MDEAKVILCRCEELSITDLQAAMEAGCVTIDDVKRRTRFGMGLCQGVYCLSEVAARLAEPTEPPLPLTQRPPARLITLAALAASYPETESN